jgi:CRISPR-associated exonuclease Cas4
MGVYFLLIEEELRIRPSHGFIVCGDGTRHRIENTDDLRAWVHDLAGRIRAARAVVSHPIRVEPVS